MFNIVLNFLYTIMKPAPPTKMVSVQLPYSLYEACKNFGINVSEVTRDALIRAVEREEKNGDIESIEVR